MWTLSHERFCHVVKANQQKMAYSNIHKAFDTVRLLCVTELDLQAQLRLFAQNVVFLLAIDSNDTIADSVIIMGNESMQIQKTLLIPKGNSFVATMFHKYIKNIHCVISNSSNLWLYAWLCIWRNKNDLINPGYRCAKVTTLTFHYRQIHLYMHKSFCTVSCVSITWHYYAFWTFV